MVCSFDACATYPCLVVGLHTTSRGLLLQAIMTGRQNLLGASMEDGWIWGFFQRRRLPLLTPLPTHVPWKIRWRAVDRPSIPSFSGSSLHVLLSDGSHSILARPGIFSGPMLCSQGWDKKKAARDRRHSSAAAKLGTSPTWRALNFGGPKARDSPPLPHGSHAGAIESSPSLTQPPPPPDIVASRALLENRFR